MLLYESLELRKMAFKLSIFSVYSPGSSFLMTVSWGPLFGFAEF